MPHSSWHSLGDALLIGRNDLAQVFGVHTRRERRRSVKQELRMFFACVVAVLDRSLIQAA
jgi:hypothetical protein